MGGKFANGALSAAFVHLFNAEQGGVELLLNEEDFEEGEILSLVETDITHLGNDPTGQLMVDRGKTALKAVDAAASLATLTKPGVTIPKVSPVHVALKVGNQVVQAGGGALVGTAQNIVNFNRRRLPFWKARFKVSLFRWDSASGWKFVATTGDFIPVKSSVMSGLFFSEKQATTALLNQARDVENRLLRNR